MDHKTLSVSLDIKQVSSRQFEGYGSVFGNVDQGGDVVIRGAFSNTLRDHKNSGEMPLMFWMHDMRQVPGVWLDMKEDDRGLYVKGELVDTQLGNEVRTLLKKKAVRGLSIGYHTREADYDREGNRLLKELDLIEVSIVSLAMNPMASIDAVKTRLSDAGEYVPTEREFERSLRDAGLSRSVARHVCAKVFDDESSSGKLREPRQRDAGDVDEDEFAKAIRLLDETSGKMISAALNNIVKV